MKRLKRLLRRARYLLFGKPKPVTDWEKYDRYLDD